jgi:hypothetical protein
LLFYVLSSGCAWLEKSPSPTKVAEGSTSFDERVVPISPVLPPPPCDAPTDSGGAIAIESGTRPSGYFNWRDNALSGSYQVGWLTGDPFAHGNSDVPNGPMLAKRYGWDFSDNWGLEARLADAWLNDSRRFNPATVQTEGILFGDLSVLFYPLGNTRFRPYAILGAGASDFKFVDSQNDKVQRVFADVPFGIGIKYPLKDWLVIRAELLDSLRVGGDDLPTMNNVSLTAGAEIRFSDLRRQLMPWRKNGDATSSPISK